MVCPPEPWPGLFGGGVLGNQECLVRVPIQDVEEKHGSAIDHYKKADMSSVLEVVNHLQQVPLRVNDDMVSLQRITWENGIDGLWPCSRAPLDVPERLGSDPDPDDLKLRNRLASQAHRAREQNRPKRVKIERSLQVAEELAGREIWQAIHSDHRGRLYVNNKFCSTQGPDNEKSLISFSHKTPTGEEGLEWLLKSAAGHNGMSRQTWHARLKWGQNNLQQMVAAATDPLGKLELWRSAKDPWQYLQACQGVKEVLETGSTGVPVRFDQTTSGCGILSTLVRDRKVAGLCNVYGSEPKDLYTVVAELVTERLIVDLQIGDTMEKALAELWLGRGIDRGLTKGPILAAPYGGSYMSLADSLVDALDEYLGFVPLDEFSYRVAVPAKYLAKHLWSEMKVEVESCLAVKSWLKKVCRKVMSKGHPLEWTTSMGWPMRLADREPTRRRINTLLFGSKISIVMADQPVDSPLSPTQANKGIGANFVHALDAAFLMDVVGRAKGKGIPLLTNHDCFACPTTHAEGLHRLLHHTYGEMYKVDWLGMFRSEIKERTGISTPEPPMINTLGEGEIGSSPYLFS